MTRRNRRLALFVALSCMILNFSILNAQTPTPSGLYGSFTPEPFYAPAAYAVLEGGEASNQIGPVSFPLNGLGQFSITEIDGPTDNPFAGIPSGLWSNHYTDANGNSLYYSDRTPNLNESVEDVECFDSCAFLPNGIAGRLVDANGKPLAFYQFIFLAPSNLNSGFYRLDPITDADGYFLITYYRPSSQIIGASSTVYKFVPPASYYVLENFNSCGQNTPNYFEVTPPYNPGTDPSVPKSYYTLRLDLGTIVNTYNYVNGPPC